jgi:hypothetical protein
MRMKLMIVGAMILFLVGIPFVPVAFAAHHITHQVTPADKFTDIETTGNHGTTGAKWKEIIPGNTNIQFNLGLGISASGGGQGYPQWVTYGVTATTGPGVPVVYFGGDPSRTSFTQTFTSPLSTGTIQVNIVAPPSDGAYTVKIFPTAKGGDGGNPRLVDDYGVTIGFTVSNPSGCIPEATSLSLTVEPSCVVYKATSTTFTATLTYGEDHVPLAGKPVEFAIENTDLGSVLTNAEGKAILTFDPSGLAVGGYTVVSSFQGDDCYYAADPSYASLGVRYDFLGFQPPVQIDGVGAGLFSGKVIPVKVRIADAQGMPVPDATAYITWTGTTANVYYEEVPAESVSAADSGNLMRYDPVSDQYIYNWNTSRLDNGSYTINIDMGEGCGGERNATVLLQKSSGKKK